MARCKHMVDLQAPALCSADDLGWLHRIDSCRAAILCDEQYHSVMPLVSCLVLGVHSCNTRLGS